jgi:anti-sigma factor RsiW
MKAQGNSCRMAERFLARYTAGTLSAEEEREFRAHYAACDDCLESVCREDPSAVFAGLRFHEPAVPGDIWPAVEERIAPKRTWGIFQWSPRIAVAALALMLIISMGVFFSRMHHGPTMTVTDKPVVFSEILLQKHLNSAANLLKPDVRMIDYDDPASKVRFTMIYDKGLKDVN